ncbi:hypothetical protein SLA2020_265390 [Shorea laevis]
MAFSPLIRRAITKTHYLRSSWCLGDRFLTHSTISNNNDKIVENAGRGCDFNRCYSNASSVGGAGLPSYMRAAVFWEPNKPLTIEELRMPRPKAGEILIKTKACGVCHSDLHVMTGELPFASPCVVGHEITGEVVEHGHLQTAKQ